jgi:acid phosphatase family membrane protein YuiD
LNKIVEDFYREHRIDEKKFKELLGHTPVEVAGGAIVGIIVGMLV